MGFAPVKNLTASAYASALMHLLSRVGRSYMNCKQNIEIGIILSLLPSAYLQQSELTGSVNTLNRILELMEQICERAVLNKHLHSMSSTKTKTHGGQAQHSFYVI